MEIDAVMWRIPRLITVSKIEMHLTFHVEEMIREQNHDKRQTVCTDRLNTSRCL